MSDQFKENLLAACLNGIRSDEFVESLVRKGALYVNDEGEATEEPCGQYCMFYVDFKDEDVAFIVTRTGKGIVIKCPTVPNLVVNYVKNPLTNAWSGISAVKSTIDGSYIYMYEILREVIGKLNIVLC